MLPDQLPGAKTPYLLRSGSGERYFGGGLVATVIARNGDTDGLLEAVVVSGGSGAAFPLHAHERSHETLYVLDGRATLRLDGREYLLSRGDYASIPPGTHHGYTFDDPYTRILFWSVASPETATNDATRLWSTLGHPYDGFVHPEGTPEPFGEHLLAAAERVADIKFLVASNEFEPGTPGQLPPDTSVPYVLASGEGERLIAGDQLFAFLAHGGNTAGKFICVTTIGPKGDPIPEHFHQLHTETFLCLDGTMTMWADGEEVRLHPGDFLHVPPGTVHSYRLDSHFTRFVGLLAPGIFEPFFRTMCDPYDGHIFPRNPKPVRFDRVIQKLHELDLKLVGLPGPPR